jgi:hypothetical protein
MVANSEEKSRYLVYSQIQIATEVFKTILSVMCFPAGVLWPESMHVQVSSQSGTPPQTT